MEKPFAITLDVGSSLANKTGSWRDERPVYVHRLPPCNNACPAGEDIQGWLYDAESGDYEAAWRTLVRDNPLPAVMGRVCYHPCETACNRAELDETVGINAVERFLGDEADSQLTDSSTPGTSVIPAARAATAASAMPPVSSWSVSASTATPRSTARATRAAGASRPSEAVECEWRSKGDIGGRF